MRYKTGIIHILSFVILLPFTLQAQDKEASRFLKRIEPIADEYYRIGDYNRALEGYLALDSINPDNTKYNYRIGICYLNSNLKSKAYPYLVFVYMQEDAPLTIFYDLARAFHYGMELEKAMVFYESYIKQLKFAPDADENEELITQIERYIQMCRNGLRMVRNPLINTDVLNLGPNINSEYDDFAPLVNKEEDLIIFTSKRPDNANSKTDPLTDQYYENIFYSNKNNGNWQKTISIGPPINNDDLHDAAVGLSPDGTKLFIYRGDDNNFNARVAGDLYVSGAKGRQWTDPVIIRAINSEGWESHASISEDGNILVFTSDREGGMGGTDIYISRRKLNKEWSEPENIGGYINTKYDEDGPFIHPDGNKLYFSSKGHDSMGDYDIFYTEYLKDKNRWTRPENVGYPINTPDDDIYFVWSADGERAWFSSQRADSYGRTDIYMLLRDDEEAEIVAVEGAIKDKVNQSPVGAQITVRDMLSNQLIGIYDTEKADGLYEMKMRKGRRYLITINSEGYQDLVTELDLSHQDDMQLVKNFEIRKRR